MYFSCMPAFSFIPENGRGLSNSSSLPVSPPGFPASNLGSKAKGRMGKIKVFPTPEYGTIVETGTSWPSGGHHPETHALPADRPGRASCPTEGLVVVVRAVFGSRLIPRRSLKKIFPSKKKPDEASATGAKAKRQAPGQQEQAQAAHAASAEEQKNDPRPAHIACSLLQATHSHIGGGHYLFSMPSGTDNSATEASLNKLFTTSWPLQLFVQLTAFWAHAHNVLLSQRTFQEGAMIGQTISAEVGWPDSAIALKVASSNGIQLCPMDAPWRTEHLAAASSTA